MASILDAGLVGIFSSIFIFLMVYALVYGVFSWMKPFGKDAAGTYAILALVIALLAAITPPVRDFIAFIAPWYVALFVMLFFILFIITMFGVKSDSDFPKIINDPRVYTWIIILCVLIAVAGLGVTLGPSLVPSTGTVPAQEGQVVVGADGVPYQQPGTIAPAPAGYGGVQAGQPGSTATPDFGTNMVNTLFHPKVLGIGVTFLVAAIAIFFLSQG